MKNFDYKLARKIIETFVSLSEVNEVYMGMQEDWFWTAHKVYENGIYQHTLPENADQLEEEYANARKNGLSMYLKEKDENGMTKLNPEYDKYTTHKIAGLYGSSWATPVIQVNLKNGDEHIFNCFTDDGKETYNPIEKIEQMLNCTAGVLSSPVTEHRLKLDVKDFKSE